jgi:hypothetical protein
MISSLIDDELHLKKYISSNNGLYRPAPEELATIIGGPCGIFLSNDDEEAVGQRNTEDGLVEDNREW